MRRAPSITAWDRYRAAIRQWFSSNGIRSRRSRNAMRINHSRNQRPPRRRPRSHGRRSRRRSISCYSSRRPEVEVSDLASVIVSTVRREIARDRARVAALEVGIGELRGEFRVLAAELRSAAVEGLAGVRERVAAPEARPPIPGPPGPAGADGMSLEHLSAHLENDRILVLELANGDRVHRASTRCDWPIDRGVWEPGVNYEAGDSVSLGGGLWIAQADTVARPGTGEAWRLAVKPGKDAKPEIDMAAIRAMLREWRDAPW